MELMWLLALVVVIGLVRWPKDMICTKCGFWGKMSRVSEGNLLLEIVLWLCFIIPGFIYSLWRFSTRSYKCPSCSSRETIPLDSPYGQELMEKRSQLKQASGDSSRKNEYYWPVDIDKK